MLEYFGRPIYLVLLLLVPAVYLVSRRSLAGLPPLRRYAAVALRTIVVLLLVLAAAELRDISKNDRLAVIYAVDVSASIPPEHREAALDFARRSSLNRDPERRDFTGLLVFGKNAGIESSPRPAHLSFESLNTLIEKDFTDIEGAIRLATAVFPEGAAKRLVLITDGNENRGHALEEARAARDRGVEISVLPISYAFPGEILLDKVVVDPEVYVGEPFDVRVVVESTRATRAMLRLFQNQQPIHGQEVELKAGKNVFLIPRQLDLADRYVYQAMIEPLAASDDAILQNNSAEGFTFIRGEPKVLFCAPDPDEDAALLQALRQERINCVKVRPEGLPSEIQEYLGYQAVILSDVPAHRLTPEHMKMLESLVKGVGLGLIMIGGKDSFGAGGYQETPIEEALPVYMDIKQKKILPNGALAIVMHSCELNNGNYWAKQTVMQAIRVLSPRDYAGVLYYGGMGGENWLFPMLPCRQKQMMLNRLNRFSPGDMLDFQRILQMALQGLNSVPASIRHIIILSDGDPNMPTASLVQAIRKAGITMSTICMGWHSNPVNMKNLARAGGGQFYPLTNANKLPSIFIREAATIRKSLISERDFFPKRQGWSSLLTGVEDFPLLKGYVLTTQKEIADQLLVSPGTEEDPTMDPILSSWAYGLGKSVAFTSDAGKRWGVHWTSWKDYRKFWSQTVRWVAREEGDQFLRANRAVEGEQGSLVLDAIDQAGNFINGLSLEANLVDPDFKSRVLEVRQVAPGRYRADFPVGRKGTYVASFRYDLEGKTYSYSTGLSVPYSPEYRQLATNEDLLRRIARASSGKVLDPLDPASVFSRDFEPARSTRDLWRGLLKLAALLFFLDIFVRRVAFDYRKMLAASVQAFQKVVLRRHREPPPADERLGALLKRKGEVRAAQEGKRKFFEPQEKEAPARLDDSFVAGAAEKKAPPRERSRPPPPKKAPAAAPEEESSYTGRLLAAKKRAMEKRDKDKLE